MRRRSHLVDEEEEDVFLEYISKDDDNDSLIPRGKKSKIKGQPHSVLETLEDKKIKSKGSTRSNKPRIRAPPRVNPYVALVNQAFDTLPFFSRIKPAQRWGYWATNMSLIVNSDGYRRPMAEYKGGSDMWHQPEESVLWTPGVFAYLIPSPPENILNPNHPLWSLDTPQWKWIPSRDMWKGYVEGDEHSAQVLASVLHKPQHIRMAEKIGAQIGPLTYDPFSESCFVFVFQTGPERYSTPVVMTRPHIPHDTCLLDPMQMDWMYRCPDCEGEAILDRPLETVMHCSSDTNPMNRSPPLWYPEHMRRFLQPDPKMGRYQRTPPKIFLHSCPRCRVWYWCPKHVGGPSYRAHLASHVVYLNDQRTQDNVLQPGVSTMACVSSDDMDKELASISLDAMKRAEQGRALGPVSRWETGRIREWNEVAFVRRSTQFTCLMGRTREEMVLSRFHWLFPKEHLLHQPVAAYAHDKKKNSAQNPP